MTAHNETVMIEENRKVVRVRPETSVKPISNAELKKAYEEAKKK